MLINKVGKFFIYTQENSSCCVQKKANQQKQWEQPILNLIKKYSDSNKNMIDVGSYIGSHSIPASEHYKNIYSFEAVLPSYELQTKSIGVNNIKNITLYNNFVSNTSNETVMIKTTKTGTGTSSVNRKLSHYNIEYPVQTIRIDDLKLNNIALVKIDVEGAEWEVLKSMYTLIEENKPTIILETFKTNTNMNNLTIFCDKYKYNYQKLTADNYLLNPI
tara:strand:+ start:1789 stop:2442 length:654 start_codon:yes stop_codon:yes gene_type:complete